MGKADYRKLNDHSHSSSTYHKKDGTAVRAILNQELINQCDGCMRDDPINEHGNHITKDGRPYMGCQKDKYREG